MSQHSTARLQMKEQLLQYDLTYVKLLLTGYSYQFINDWIAGFVC